MYAFVNQETYRIMFGTVADMLFVSHCRRYVVCFLFSWKSVKNLLVWKKNGARRMKKLKSGVLSASNKQPKKK